MAPHAAGSERSIPNARRQMLMHVMILVGSQAELSQVVAALHAAGGLSDLLHRRQEQADQDGNNGDDDQQLDQRKAAPSDNSWRLKHGCTSCSVRRFGKPFYPGIRYR